MDWDVRPRISTPRIFTLRALGKKCSYLFDRLALHSRGSPRGTRPAISTAPAALWLTNGSKLDRAGRGPSCFAAGSRTDCARERCRRDRTFPRFGSQPKMVGWLLSPLRLRSHRKTPPPMSRPAPPPPVEDSAYQEALRFLYDRINYEKLVRGHVALSLSAPADHRIASRAWTSRRIPLRRHGPQPKTVPLDPSSLAPRARARSPRWWPRSLSCASGMRTGLYTSPHLHPPGGAVSRSMASPALRPGRDFN